MLGDRQGNILDRLKRPIENGELIEPKHFFPGGDGHRNLGSRRQSQFYGSLFGHDAPRRSKRSRAMMAAALTNRSTPSRTTIPAAVRETNSSWGWRAQL